MKKYWIKDLAGNQVIHAPTLEIAKKLCSRFDELNLRWNSGRRYTDSSTNWDNYLDGTCYLSTIGVYADIEWYKDKEFEILTIENLLDFQEGEECWIDPTSIFEYGED